jgi:hypothetical protein
MDRVLVTPARRGVVIVGHLGQQAFVVVIRAAVLIVWASSSGRASTVASQASLSCSSRPSCWERRSPHLAGAASNGPGDSASSWLTPATRKPPASQSA